MRFSDLRIRQKIALAFAAIVLGAAMMGLVVRGYMDRIETAQQATALHNAVITATIEARAAMSRQENSLRGFLITRDDYYSGRVKRHADSFAKQIETIRGIGSIMGDLSAKLDLITKNSAAWQSEIAAKAMMLARSPETLGEASALITSDAASALIDPIEETLDGWRDAETTAIAENVAAQDAAFSQASWTFVGGTVALLLLSIGLAILLTRTLARPISGLCDGMEKLARGDASIAVAGLGRKDEIGQMAAALDRLKAVSREHQVLEADALASGRAEKERQASDAAMSEGYAVAHAFFMQEVGEGFAKLSDGDLGARLNKPFSSDYEAMRELFNTSVAKLEDAFGAVVQSVGAIRTGLGEITVASNDLSQRTEQQAASLEETVAALSDVTRGIGETADGANRAQAAAAQAQSDALKGNEIVGRAVAAMSAIEESSEKIGRIIGVIDEIAFQTNLLALNAGVEAARAGEAGRGFAVVAQEVRGLAQRSADAAKEIKTLIAASTAQVADGVELVTASGHSLDEIVEQVGKMSQVVSDIAQSARAQALSLKEVSAAADNMDKVTQQNAAMVEETTAAAQHLASETEALAALTDGFRVRAAAPAAVRPIRRPAPAPSKPVAQMRAVGRSGAAPAPTSNADDWEEF
ncbi:MULTISPECIES: methyl-accepting chemotaxis protein [unclassified Aureimonas]|uniref:methyl-accepting chemotaxis protein n=1 Tax=unclassified Aureimonas TaxID=2615206 RepID=UPI0006F4EEE7|nr:MULTISPECIES: methyl-accepting chemotaxis protein [unclassified Aureimonas]KQT53915.1 hypothetical protein ASG62_11825 [Aureimonas sp. Leaf427]KQT71645.1 hypothetical protein ASG54_19335 [Aureimonas sp. Leaf460]